MGGKKLPDPELFYQIFGKKKLLNVPGKFCWQNGTSPVKDMPHYENNGRPAHSFYREMAEDFQRRYKEKTAESEAFTGTGGNTGYM